MFSILDGILIIFIVLSIFIGIRRGFIGSLAKLLGGFLKLVVSILLAKPLVKLISLTKLDEHMFDRLATKFASVSDKFNVNLVGMDQDELNLFVADALSDAKIPKLFRGFFANVFSLSPETIASKDSVTLAELMGVSIGNIVLLVCSFVFLLLFFWLVSKIVIRCSKRVNKTETFFAKTNRWLGGLFGFVKSSIIVFALFVVVSFLADFSFMNKIVDYIQSSWFSRFLYNISTKLIESSFDIKAMLENWIIKG